MGNQLNAAEQWDRLKPYAAGAIQRAADAAVARALAAAGRPASAGGGAGGGGGGGSGGGGGVAAHVLATTTGLSSKHTVSGLTAGQVLQATGATTALFGVLSHTYLTDLTTGDPHTQYALRARQIIAGNGMSGGGTLAADRTLTLGTPSTITDSTTNAVTTSSHTHAVDAYASRVTGQSGILRANDGALTLSTLKSESLISNTELTVTPGTYVVLSDGKALRTASYSSGFAGGGFQLDQGVSSAGITSLEVDSLTVRGTLRVYELLIQKIRATNGSIMVSSTGKIRTRALYSGTEGLLNSEYTLNTDLETGHGFAVGDLIRAQKYTGTGTYQSNMEVVGVYSASNFRAKLLGGAAPQVDYEYVRLGSTADVARRGGVYMTADDLNAPYLDIFDGVDSFAAWGSANKTKVRLGKLDGITGGTNEYGLWAGAITLGNLVATGSKIALRQGTAEKITLGADGNSYFAGVLTIGTAGEIRQGTVSSGNVWDAWAGVSGFTGLRMWRESNIGRIGGYNAGTLQWAMDTAGRLTAGGGTVLFDANGIGILSGGAYSYTTSYSFRDGTTAYAGLGSYYTPTTYYLALTVENKTAHSPYLSIESNGTTTYPGSINLMAQGATYSHFVLTPALATLDVPLSTPTGVALRLQSDGTNILVSPKDTNEAYLQLGAARTGSGTSYLDLVGDTTYTDYGARLARGNSGANATTQLLHRGTGALSLIAVEAAIVTIATSNTTRFTINDTGLVGIGVSPATQKLKVAGSVAVGGDDGGTASYTTLTNATQGVSSGSGTIKMNGFTGRNSVGWLKIYVGTTAVYLPYFDTITG